MDIAIKGLVILLQQILEFWTEYKHLQVEFVDNINGQGNGYFEIPSQKKLLIYTNKNASERLEKHLLRHNELQKGLRQPTKNRTSISDTMRNKKVSFSLQII